MKKDRGKVMSYINFKDINKIYTMGEVQLKALNEVSLRIDEGKFVVIIGASGAGKTTLLNILGGMDTPTSGKLSIDKEEVSRYSKKELTLYRREKIGFVFQFYNLIPNLTALENVEIATEIAKEPFDPETILKEVGLGEKLNHFPAQLSGGEQQRVSIARAIAKNPKLLLCDEPTGALDYETGRSVLTLLKEMCEKYKMTVVVITHNHAIAPIANAVIKLKNGKIDHYYENEKILSVDEVAW